MQSMTYPSGQTFVFGPPLCVLNNVAQQISWRLVDGSYRRESLADPLPILPGRCCNSALFVEMRFVPWDVRQT